MVHGRKKFVWSENKFDSTSKRECFFTIWVHGHLKRRHVWYMVEKKMCSVCKQVGQYVKKRMFLCIKGAWSFKKSKHLWNTVEKCVWSGNKLDSVTKGECFSAFRVHGYLKTQAFKVHGRRKCVWSGNKFDSTSKKMFSAFWVHDYLKTQAFMLHDTEKCVWSGNQLDSTPKRECFSAFLVHGYFKKQVIYSKVI